MTTALISDIHGNFVALDTVLAAIAPLTVDRVLCLGDIAASGPQPVAVIERLRDENIICVQGRTDAWLLNPPHRDTQTRTGVIDRWCADRIGPEHRDFLAAMPPVTWFEFAPPHKLFAFHGAPNNNREKLQPSTSMETLREWLLPYRQASVFACGSTHQQYVMTLGSSYIISPGSVGAPIVHGADGPFKPAYAEYALVDFAGATAQVTLRRVPLDIDAVRAAAYDARMPNGEWWAQTWQEEV